MTPTMRQRRMRAVLALLVMCSLSAAAQHYKYDIPEDTMKSAGSQVWGVGVKRSHAGYKAHSMTRLNGTEPIREVPTAAITAGTTGVWQWEVRAVPSLVPSWETWKNDPRVQIRAQGPDDWSHPVATWEQAFGRAYKVVEYLLGRPPLPMKLTLLLFPKASAYDKIVVREDASAIPLTLAFYYPPATEPGTPARYEAMLLAVSTSIYEYQHPYPQLEAIAPMGENKTDKVINDEARSQCWYDSTFLALTANTHSETAWNPAPPGKIPPGERHPNEKRRYEDAWEWGVYLELGMVSDYLKQRGIAHNTVLSNDPAGMNAVLSACRALTQRPFDLTSGPYPPAQIGFVPFFPDPLPPPRPKPETDTK
jgi:hypothetical protein